EENRSGLLLSREMQESFTHRRQKQSGEIRCDQEWRVDHVIRIARGEQHQAGNPECERAAAEIASLGSHGDSKQKPWQPRCAVNSVRETDDFGYLQAGAGNHGSKQCNMGWKGKAPQPVVKADAEQADPHDREQGVVPRREAAGRDIEGEIEKIERIKGLSERIGKERIAGELGWRPQRKMAARQSNKQVSLVIVLCVVEIVSDRQQPKRVRPQEQERPCGYD